MTHSLLTRRVAEIIDSKHLQKRLAAGDILRVKLGIDPSKPELHIGHGVTLRKLREFQDAGHTAVLIIGDYTAQIGDPTDRSEARKILSPEEVKRNAETYLEQAYKILDRQKTEIHWQSEWFNDFTLRDVIELLATTTVNNLLSHETFAKRLETPDDNFKKALYALRGGPLYGHELLYPLMQGYDSVMVKSDLELGGADQKFNVLMGRVLQRAHNQREQDILLVPYLPGTDGQAKMSKSLGNTINLTDAPNDMYGKVMSLPDSLIVTYFDLATTLSETDVETIAEELASGSVNPRDLKAQLARQIVSEYHSPQAAEAAEAHFEQVFRQKQVPDAVETLVLPAGEYDIADILANRTTIVASKSEARRIIAQQGVKKNQVTVANSDTTVSPADGQEVVVQVGPRRFVKIVWKGEQS